MKKYKEGYKLQDNEFLLKIESDEHSETGFMTKFNKDGSVPVSFKNWPPYYRRRNDPELPIYIVEEVFRSGWKLYGSRWGTSRNWAVLMHPLGYTVEIHMEEYLDLIQTVESINGELIGEYKWCQYKLTKNER